MFKYGVIVPVSFAIEVFTDRWDRFPVVLWRDNVLIDGLAALDLTNGDFDYIYGVDVSRIPEWRLLERATGLSIRDMHRTQRVINLGFQGHVRGGDSSVPVLDRAELPDVNHRLRIGASPFSVLAQSVSSFLMTPISSDQNMIVFNPENPTQYAFDNQLFYARSAIDDRWESRFGHLDLWGVNTHIRFANDSSMTEPVRDSAMTGSEDEDDDSPLFMPCLIGDLPSVYGQMEDFLSVPRRFESVFMSLARQRGIRLENSYVSIYLMDVDDAMVDTFPTLQYIVQMENGAEINVGHLKPREYIVPTQFPNRRRLRFHRDRRSDFCTFDKILRDRMVIHFDTQNQRIGFGEPLVEL